MAVTLERALRYVYNNESYSCGYIPDDNILNSNNSKFVFFDIPITGSKIELPTFIVPSLIQVKEAEQDYTKIAKIIKRSRYKSYNKSIPVAVKNIIASPVNSDLFKVKLDGLTDTYYIMRGAIFDYNYNCLALCTWEIEEYSEVMYLYKKPIFRINPVCYRYPDAMKKFITGKMLNAINNTDCTYMRNGAGITWRNSVTLPVTTIIEEIPFAIHSAVSPTVDTDRNTLMDTVIQHSDNIL